MKALAVGLNGTISSSRIVVKAGIAEMVAGSRVMCKGGFSAGRTEALHYKSKLKREYEEVEQFRKRRSQK